MRVLVLVRVHVGGCGRVIGPGPADTPTACLLRHTAHIGIRAGERKAALPCTTVHVHADTYGWRSCIGRGCVQVECSCSRVGQNGAAGGMD